MPVSRATEPGSHSPRRLDGVASNPRLTTITPSPDVAWPGLVWTLVRTDFKARYHGTASGFVWALLKPATMFAVLVAVFSFVFANEPTYRLDLIIGLFLWDFFADATKTGMTSLSAKSFLLTKAKLPRWIVIVTSMANAVLTLVVFAVVTSLFVAASGRAPGLGAFAAFGVYLLALMLMVVGLSLASSVLFLAVSGPQPGLGHGDAGRLLPGADHLSARRHPGTIPPLAVSVAAYAGHRVRPQRAGRWHVADGARTCVSGAAGRCVARRRHRHLRPLCASGGGIPVSPASLLDVEAVSKTFLIPSVRRDTVREHVFGLLERRRFEQLRVLDQVTFSLHRGETLGIMGRNGSGKSTLLRVLCGIYSPDGGRVHRHVGITPILELGVGWNPELDAIDNVYLMGTVLGLTLKSIAAQLEGILAFAELDRFARLKLKHYSSGMASRLAYAVAFAAVREVLVLDEIFAVGDAGFRARCEARYAQLRDAGHTVLMVSHDPRTIGTFCDRALLLDGGRIVAEGPGADIAARYVETLTATP